MRASVLYEQGKPLGVEELALESPRAGEVLVRMVASGVCHSCLHAADGYPIGRVVQSACACGGSVFRLVGNPQEGCAKRICPSCQAEQFICDSAEIWDEARPEACVCPCTGELF